MASSLGAGLGLSAGALALLGIFFVVCGASLSKKLRKRSGTRSNGEGAAAAAAPAPAGGAADGGAADGGAAAAAVNPERPRSESHYQPVITSAMGPRASDTTIDVVEQGGAAPSAGVEGEDESASVEVYQSFVPGDVSASGKDFTRQYAAIPKEASAEPVANRTNLWEVAVEDLLWGPELGRGAFGIVYDALHMNRRVAIKVLTQLSPEAMVSFQGEAEVMMSNRPHENVLQLVGICHDPFAIVTEFAELGSLDAWRLSAGRNASEETLSAIAFAIARGVKHLHDGKIIHRDLAARNILLSPGRTSDELVPKVADFGLSRQDSGDEENVTLADNGPLKWMAPECLLDSVYSVKSDAWGYAVLLIELYTGCMPFPEYKNVEWSAKICSRTAKVEPPLNAPPFIQDLVRDCTNFDPALRPDFGTIVSRFGGSSTPPTGGSGTPATPNYVNVREMQEEP